MVTSVQDLFVFAVSALAAVSLTMPPASGGAQPRPAAPGGASRPTAQSIQRLSLASDGTQADAPSSRPSVSDDGRYLVFQSLSDRLDGMPSNGQAHIFLADRLAGTVQRVSVRAGGSPANGGGSDASITPDGRFVVFVSSSPDLVAGDTNDATDVFVYDVQTGAVERVSISTEGAQADGSSGGVPAISADGRYVVFQSGAGNLVRNDTNEKADVFLRDRRLGTTERISVGLNGRESDGYSFSNRSSVSSDGRFVAYFSTASNLVAGDRNETLDVFVYDRQTGKTERISKGQNDREPLAASYRPTLSADGRYVAFASMAPNLVAGDRNYRDDVFVYDRTAGKMERASVSGRGKEADARSGSPVISADGRYVAFSSQASNLVPDDENGLEDLFIYDRQSRSVERVSTSDGRREANGASYGPAVSSDGRFVAFTSQAANLVAGDTNQVADVFIRDRQTGSRPGD